MWLNLTLATFATFLGGLFAFVWLGCNRDGTIKRRGGLWLALAAGSFLLWAYALTRVPPPYPIEYLKNYVAPPYVGNSAAP